MDSELEFQRAMNQLFGRHRDWTPDCPPLLALLEDQLISEERRHAVDCAFCRRMLAIRDRVASESPFPLTIVPPVLPDWGAVVRSVFTQVMEVLLPHNPSLAIGTRRDDGMRPSSPGEMDPAELFWERGNAELALGDGRVLRWKRDPDSQVSLRLEDDLGDPLPGLRLGMDRDEATPAPPGWVLLPRDISEGLTLHVEPPDT